MTRIELYEAMVCGNTVYYKKMSYLVKSVAMGGTWLYYPNGSSETVEFVDHYNLPMINPEMGSAYDDRPFMKYESHGQRYYDAEVVDAFFEKYEPELKRIPQK